MEKQIKELENSNIEFEKINSELRSEILKIQNSTPTFESENSVNDEINDVEEVIF